MGFVTLSHYETTSRRNELMMTLIARWVTNEDATLEPPTVLQWEDGTPATQDDYLKHLSDTHAWVITPLLGIERRAYPNIVADVRFDGAAGSWVISGQEVIPASLELPDRDATDDQILAELYTYPVIYRARIHR
jgi:hypothetical protein